MPSSDDLARVVVPISGVRSTVVGTGVIVRRHLVLTALHVIDPEPLRRLRVGGEHRVRAVASLPVRRFGAQRGLGLICYHRDWILTHDDLGTVDLALLAVPGLTGIPLPLCRSGIEDGETVKVLGYPDGQKRSASGTVLSHDEANFLVGVSLTGGASGAPAIDVAGHLAGLAVLEHETGTIFIGSALITTFLRQAIPLLRTFVAHRRR